ncbi:hypothetical protein BCh11DRAFT_03753 [Burkholderia sp. Ch1-1]|nr:hypothetical protein BCh11DRAFT_03753 [Burkholderia sp. Ch1-1]
MSHAWALTVRRIVFPRADRQRSRLHKGICYRLVLGGLPIPPIAVKASHIELTPEGFITRRKVTMVRESIEPGKSV